MPDEHDTTARAPGQVKIIRRGSSIRQIQEYNAKHTPSRMFLLEFCQSTIGAYQKRTFPSRRFRGEKFWLNPPEAVDFQLAEDGQSLNAFYLNYHEQTRLATLDVDDKEDRPKAEGQARKEMEALRDTAIASFGWHPAIVTSSSGRGFHLHFRFANPIHYNAAKHVLEAICASACPGATDIEIKLTQCAVPLSLNSMLLTVDGWPYSQEPEGDYGKEEEDEQAEEVDTERNLEILKAALAIIPDPGIYEKRWQMRRAAYRATGGHLEALQAIKDWIEPDQPKGWCPDLKWNRDRFDTSNKGLAYIIWAARQHDPTFQKSKPVVKYPSGQISVLVEGLYEPLGKSPSLFTLGSRLVRVAAKGEKSAIRNSRKVVVQQATAGIITMEAAAAVKTYRVNTLKDNTKKRARVDVPLVASSLYLDQRPHWNHPPLAGIALAPVMLPDGSLITKEGYEKNTGLWINAPVGIENMLDPNPSRQHAEMALERIRTLFRTLSFADSPMMLDRTTGEKIVDISKSPEMDESSFLIGGLFSAVARFSVPRVPMFVVNAPNISGSGTGKGLTIKSCIYTATGLQAVSFTPGDNPAELEKRIVATMMESPPYLWIDNANLRSIGGDQLESLITETPSHLRVLGKSEMVEIDHRTFFAACGNALTVRGDSVRRIIMCELDAGTDTPEARKFSKDLYTDVRRSRRTLLRDIFLILRWGIRDNPPQGLASGSFSEWARLVRDPLVALGCRDPIARQAEMKRDDPSRDLWLEAFTVLHETFGELPFTCAQALDNGKTRSALWAAIRRGKDADEDGLLNARRLGRCFKDQRGTSIAGYRFFATPRTSGHDVATYHVEKIKSEPPVNSAAALGRELVR